jgi:tRNA/tmRNA/rRNA uracil-C5-methylase (TrmA/RlmC/RlmD family)
MISLPVGCHPLCRACSHRLLTQEQSLNQKTGFLKEKLQQWEGLIMPVRSLDGAQRWGYRTRTALGVQFDGQQWRWGLWNRDELLFIPDCPVHQPAVNRIIKTLMQSLPLFDFGLRWLVMSGSQLTLVVKGTHLPLVAWPKAELFAQLERLGLEGLWLHTNPSTGRRIFGKNGWTLLFGKDTSLDAAGLYYGPATFSQLIPVLYAEALAAAADFLKPDSNSAVVDLYSGTGSSLRLWSEAGAQLIGVEAIPEAVKLARLNIPKAEVLVGSCRLRLPQLDAWTRRHSDAGKMILAYVNPPRTGIEPEVLHWLVRSANPARIAYLSCSPGTLARDLQFLCANGYSISRLMPYDFFPQTHHIETLALIEIQH